MTSILCKVVYGGIVQGVNFLFEKSRQDNSNKMTSEGVR